MVPVAVLLIGTVALIVSAPASVLLGAPLVWGLQRQLRRWPLTGTVALAMVGMIAAIPINGLVNDGDAERDLWTAMLFGGVVAGAHGVVLAHRNRRRWSRTVALAGMAALIGSIAGRLILDGFWNRRAVQATEACARGYDFASHVTARERLPALARAQGRSFEQGRWSIRSPNPALLGDTAQCSWTGCGRWWRRTSPMSRSCHGIGWVRRARPRRNAF